MSISIISNYQYQYFKILEESKKKQQSFYRSLLLNKLFSFQKIDFIQNSLDIIYEAIIKEIPKQYNNLIYEDNFVNSDIFLEYANKFYGSIITQWSLGKFIKDSYSKTHNIVSNYSKKISKKVSSIIQSTGQALKQAWNQTVSFTSKAIGKGWDLVKKIGSAIWEGIKKLGDTVFGFVKNVLDIAKEGLTIGDNVAKGGHCGYSQPSDIPKKLNQTKQKVDKVIPFMSSSLDAAKQAGKQDNSKVIQMQKSLATGGNINQKLKQATDSLGNKAKAGMTTQLEGPAISQAKQFNKDLQKTIPKEQREKLEKNPQTPETKIEKENIQFLEKRSQNIIKEWIIDLAYKGLTPKTIIEAKYKKSFGPYQNDIIIAQSKLSFKTLNGNLICQETNLKTNDKIIYQTNTQFLGNHLIWQESQQEYINPNKIISQQKLLQNNKIISEEIDWLSVMLWGSLVLGIIIILAVIAAVIAGALHCVIPGSGFIVTALNSLLTPFYTVGAALTGGVTTFGGAVGATFGALTTATTVKGGYDMAKTGYDAKLGDGLQVGNQEEINQLKGDVENGPSLDDLQKQIQAL